MKRATQHFSESYLKESQRLSPTDVVRFIEEFQRIHSQSEAGDSVMISLRIDRGLLEAFRTRAKLEGIRYQTKIKSLMEEWIKSAR